MLYATDMPGVLTEIGFMSNQQELAYMKSDRGQNEIARSLYQAIRNYSAYVLGTRMAEEEQAAAAKPAAEQPAEKSAGKAAEKSVEKPAAKSAEKTAAAQPAEGKTATGSSGQNPGETGRTAPALYDSGDGFGVVRAPRLGAVPCLPRQGEGVCGRGTVPL